MAGVNLDEASRSDHPGAGRARPPYPSAIVDLDRVLATKVCKTYISNYNDLMSEIAITDARARLASIIDASRDAPVYLTRRNRAVAAVVDAAQLERLIDDAEELADIRAVDAAWEETERLGETPIPWEDVKRDLGLS